VAQVNAKKLKHSRRMVIAKTVPLEQCPVMTKSHALRKLAPKDNSNLIVMFAAINVSHINFPQMKEYALTVQNTKKQVQILNHVYCQLVLLDKLSQLEESA